MSNLSKRSTIYFDPDIHRALKLQSFEASQSISAIVDSAIRLELAEDEEDIMAIKERRDESTISLEALLKDLKLNGKI